MYVLYIMLECSFLERRIGMLDEKLGKVLRIRSDSQSLIVFCQYQERDRLDIKYCEIMNIEKYVIKQ